MSTLMTGRRAGARRSLVVAVLAAALVATPVAPSAAATAPGKPKVLKVFVKGTNTLKAKWSTGKKATRYQVLVARNKKMTKGRKVYTVKGRAKTITGLRQGTTYYVKVRSYRGKKKSGWSPRKSARTLYSTPSTPRLAGRGTGYSSATFSWTPATYATQYRLVLTRGPGMAVLQRTPWQYSRAKVLGGLRALPAGSYYYARVEASNAGRASRYSAAVRLSLRPYSPISPRPVGTGARSVTVGWTRATSAERYQLQARTPAGAVARTVTTNHLAEGFAAVNGMPAGVSYQYYVRSLSGSFTSGWVYAGSAAAKDVAYTLRVGSYNVACANPGLRCSTVHPWLRRRTAVAQQIERVNFDVLGLQELSTTNIGTSPARSQAGSLNDALDGRFKYGPSRTTGRWFLYNDDTVTPDGTGGLLTIGYSASVKKPAYAIWQVFTHRGSGKRFAAVNAHTEPYVGPEGDRARYKQTRSLVSQVQALPQLRGLPVLYVGDYNSHEFRGYDAPRAVFNQLGMLDGDDFAADRGRWWLNSASGWRNPNPRQGAQVDHVYVPRTVGVRASQVELDADDTGRWRSQIPSDHNPVRVDLDMPAS